MIGLVKQCLSQGGGSAAVSAHHNVTLYEAFEEAVGGKIQLSYAEGASVLRNLPPCSDGVVDLEGFATKEVETSAFFPFDPWRCSKGQLRRR